MTARTPLATLTLARDYLDSLLADSTPGPWTRSASGEWIATRLDDGPEDIAQVFEPADSNLIVALHATAPAIRELLSDEIMRMNDRIGQFTTLVPTAAAILSTSHAAQWITDRESDLVDELEREQWARDHMYDNPEDATQ